MTQNIRLMPQQLRPLREGDPRLLSYNVEMTEITGGTFWKPYTSGQIDGVEEFPMITSIADFQNMLTWFDPIDPSDPKLRALAGALGSAWVRVSGSWATKTYYDFDGHTGGNPPEGFQSVLTKEQWNGVLDFVRAIDGKLMISMANCIGVHNEDGSWNPEQARLIFEYSRDYGVPISAAEFMNEPNSIEISGAPAGYTAADFARDQDTFFRFMREEFPEVLLVGPCATGDAGIGEEVTDHSNPLIESMRSIPSEELLADTKERADIFSYHYYNGISERGAGMSGHWPADKATSESYLDVAPHAVRYYLPMRDKWCPGAPLWVTESGDAGCGGNTWASTYLDVIRYANELGYFGTKAEGVIFHNTLCSSDYGLLAHGTYEPRPNYWLALLWNTLMGTTVYDTEEPIREGVHLYAQSRKDGKPGAVYLLVNNSTTEETLVDIPASAQIYSLSAPTLRSRKMYLNGEALELKHGYEIPELKPILTSAGVWSAKPATISFIVV